MSLMRILNLGSLNLDKVYDVEHFVLPGETIQAENLGRFLGGKGLNQSVAAARAGAQVYHAGAVGPDGDALRELLEQAGVDVQYLQKLSVESGHAILQVTPQGQNAIIVYSGANGALTKKYISDVICNFDSGDILLLQNETANVGWAIEEAKRRGMQVAFNASPITERMARYPLEKVDWFLINEVEGRALAKSTAREETMVLQEMCERFPNASVVLTAGSKGVYYGAGGRRCFHGVYDVPVVDTTAAGDTFCGYFIACIARGADVQQALRYASCASNLAVSKKGAANSIPVWGEVAAFAKKNPEKENTCAPARERG